MHIIVTINEITFIGQTQAFPPTLETMYLQAYVLESACSLTHHTLSGLKKITYDLLLLLLLYSSGIKELFIIKVGDKCGN